MAKALLGIVVLLSFTEGVNLDLHFSMVEYFSGKANVANTFKSDISQKVATFELQDSRSMDMNSSPGFSFLAIFLASGSSTMGNWINEYSCNTHTQYT